MKLEAPKMHASFRALVASVALFAAVGCGSTKAATKTEAPSHELVRDDVPRALRSAMQRIGAALERAGKKRGSETMSGFLPGGNHATFALTVPADSCVTLVALATRNVRDVDAALYSPEGDLLALDAEPDARPTIQACAGSAPRPLYYIIQLFEGDGSFLVVPFFGPRGTLEAAARVLGGRRPALAVSTSGAGLEEDPLANLMEGLRKRGYRPEGEPLSFPIAERERVRTQLPVRAGQCYTVAAFGSGVRNLRLRVLDERGSVRIIAEDGQPHAAAQLCAQSTVSYAIESEAQAGAGQIKLIVYRAEVAVAGGEAGLWLGKRVESRIEP